MVLTSDGGFRSGLAGSSFGWVLWAVDKNTRSYETVAFGYAYWAGGKSAFEAEVLGLEAAFGGLCKFLSGTPAIRSDRQQ